MQTCKRALITFGCSWTSGIGVGYRPGMSKEEFQKIAWDKQFTNPLSFRGIISREYGFDNISFAYGGSSNQMQFRLAKEFFVSSQFDELRKNYEDIVVLWTITSTARNEMFSIEKNSLYNFKYDETDTNLVQAIAKFSYNHDHEVKMLTTEMLFWNDYFKHKGLKNIWLDMFNHHNYSIDIKNLIGNESNCRDMLSQLCIKNGFKDIDKNYHKSSWHIDSNRVSFLVDCGVLNPISKHPTELGHRQITELIIESVQGSILR